MIAQTSTLPHTPLLGRRARISFPSETAPDKDCQMGFQVVKSRNSFSIVQVDIGWKSEDLLEPQGEIALVSRLYDGTAPGEGLLSSPFNFILNTLKPILREPDSGTALPVQPRGELSNIFASSHAKKDSILWPFSPPAPLLAAKEFLPSRLISFAESLIELILAEAEDSGIPVLGFEWSVFTDPQDSSKELVLAVTVNATSYQALDFWDVAAESVSVRKNDLSANDQALLNKHLSIQIHWP